MSFSTPDYSSRKPTPTQLQLKADINVSPPRKTSKKLSATQRGGESERSRKMEAAVPIMASNRSPESLRQRQRDRLSPRGRFTKTAKISTSVRDTDGQVKSGITLAPAPRSKVVGNWSPEALKKKQMQDGLRKENSINRRAKREVEDVRNDIVPDGSSAGREGRQFTVAKVGNNGRIYLR